jgi:formylglycine-generating enzyme required for sulfatase activity
MKFRLIPPGEYRMGTSIKEFLNEQPLVTAHESDHRLATERPQHRVVITTPFFLGIHEVTQDQYESVMGENPSHFRKGGAGEASVAGMESADWPVDSVSVSDAVDFCIKLSQFDQFEVLYERQSGFDVPINPTRPGYRLPTEAEWEWACRAGTNTRFWSSDRDRDLKEVAWFKGNSTDLPHPVGKLKANPFGLFDVSGNVGELCVDGFTYIYFQTELDRRYAVDPFFRATSGQPRVVRGGNSLSQPESLRPAMRTAIRPDHKDPNTGFRVVLTIEGARKLKSE